MKVLKDGAKRTDFAIRMDAANSINAIRKALNSHGMRLILDNQGFNKIVPKPTVAGEVGDAIRKTSNKK